MKTLTDRGLKALRFTGRRITVLDTLTAREGVHGLALRVGARKKVWYLQYRYRGSTTQRYRLGDFPALSLADARKAARAARAMLDKGVDPAAERRKPPPEPAPTPQAFLFSDFVPTFVAFQKGRTKTWGDDEAMIERYLLEPWAALPLSEITRRHVHEVLDSVAGKGLTIGVNRLQALISRIFTVALDRSLIDAHPAARMIKRFKEQASDRVLTDDELRALWAGLDALPSAASDAVRLRLLLGQRGGETAGMMWGELDLDAALWTLPRPRTKTQKKQHVVPLPPTSLALLKRRRQLVAADELRVFPDLVLTDGDHKALSVIHGGAYEWKDLRRTVGTRLAELGFDETARGRVLNHARFSVTDKHYNAHQYTDEIKQALTAWDVELQRIIAKKPKKQSRVLPMRRRR